MRNPAIITVGKDQSKSEMHNESLISEGFT